MYSVHSPSDNHTLKTTESLACLVRLSCFRTARMKKYPKASPKTMTNSDKAE